MHTRYEGEAKKLADAFCRRMNSYTGVKTSVLVSLEKGAKKGQILSILYVHKKLDNQKSLDFVYRLKGAPFTAELLMDLEQQVIRVLSLVE